MLLWNKNIESENLTTFLVKCCKKIYKTRAIVENEPELRRDFGARAKQRWENGLYNVYISCCRQLFLNGKGFQSYISERTSKKNFLEIEVP